MCWSWSIFAYKHHSPQSKVGPQETRALVTAPKQMQIFMTLWLLEKASRAPLPPSTLSSAIWQEAAKIQQLHIFSLLLHPLLAAFPQTSFCKSIWKERAFHLISRLYKQKPFVSHLTKLSLFPGSSRCLNPTGLRQEFAVADPVPTSARDLLLRWHSALLSLRLSHCCLASSKVQMHEAMLWRKPIRKDRRNISLWLRPDPGLSRIRAAWRLSQGGR